jgi:hypothetical protein
MTGAEGISRHHCSAPFPGFNSALREGPRVRRLAPGGSRIRTIGSARHDQVLDAGSCHLCLVPRTRGVGANENRNHEDAWRLPRNRWFESRPLQERVQCELRPRCPRLPSSYPDRRPAQRRFGLTKSTLKPVATPSTNGNGPPLAPSWGSLSGSPVSAFRWCREDRLAKVAAR